MKTITRMLLCVSLAVCLLLGLCACKKEKSGTYILSSITYADGTTISGKDLQTEIEDVWGMELSDIYLQLNPDGTGILSVYGIEQEIGYKDDYFWYTDYLDVSLEIEEPLEFDEEGFPIENTEETEATEPEIPEDLRLPLTVSGKTVTLDPDGFGDILTFTRK